MSDQVISVSETAIAQGSKSFAAAAKLFDRATRDDAVMLYAWCRHCDDVIDGQTLGHDQAYDFRTGQLDRLETLRRHTADALAGHRSDDAVFEALRRVVERHGIPHRHPQELLNGFAMDVEQRRYETLSDTLDYCYHVAGVVGVMMAMIMGARQAEVLDRASDLGIAFQLTNIARDVIDDARAGRVYLPDEILARRGVKSVDPDDIGQHPALHAAALDLLALADAYYQSALTGMASLPPRSAWAIAAARRVYRDIGNKMRKRGPDAWRERISTGTARKLYLLTVSLADVAGSRFATPPQPRMGLWQRPA